MLLVSFRSFAMIYMVIVAFPHGNLFPRSFKDARPRRPRTTFVKAIISNPQVMDNEILAQKLAKDAVMSTKMQKTIKQLANLKIPKENPNFSHSPVVKKNRKMRKKKRRRKNRPKNRKGRSQGLKIFRNNRRDGLDDQLRGWKNDSKITNLMVTASKDSMKKNRDDQGIEYFDYYSLDEENPSFSDSSTSKKSRKNRKMRKKKKKKRKKKNKSKNRESRSQSFKLFRNNRRKGLDDRLMGWNNESMIANLMITTTKDPTKKNRDDQGMEYSDYYSVDEENPSFSDDFLPNIEDSSRENSASLTPDHSNGDFLKRKIEEKENLRSSRDANVSFIYENYPDYYDDLEQSYQRNQQFNIPEVKKPKSGGRFSGEHFMPKWLNRRMCDDSSLTCHPRKQKTINISDVEKVTSDTNDSNNETKQVANQILSRIIDRLEEAKSNNFKKKLKEGFPCRISGSWVTTQACVKIEMRVSNRLIDVTLAKLQDENHPGREGIIDASWNISGQAPFRRGAPFSLLAINRKTKSIASFIGACRICQGVDTIQGVWSSIREPKDCTDFSMALTNTNDIFRRIT